MQDHSEYVKQNVSFHENVVLRGFRVDDAIHLLEGSHRMAYAIELNVPVTIVLFGENEIIPNDCDVVSITRQTDRCAVRELVHDLMTERGKYNQAEYESNDYPNIKIIDASDGTGKLAHMQLTHPHMTSGNYQNEKIAMANDALMNPCSAFPEKLHLTILYALGQKILVIGNHENRPAIAFSKLGADVTYIDLSENILSDTGQFVKDNNLNIQIAAFHDFKLSVLPDDVYDIIYSVDICSHANKAKELQALFESYKRVLKSGGLLVTLDTHPFFNLFDTAKPLEKMICRSYDDLQTDHITGKVPWRIEDIIRCIHAAGLKTGKFVELQTGYDLYDKGWYSSVEERYHDGDKRSDVRNNPLAAIPRWLATFSHK